MSLKLRCAVALLLSMIGSGHAQIPQPNGARVRRGVLPRSWRGSGPHCSAKPEFQVHEYNSDLYILRESGCSDFEKPFLYLLFGREKALLLDTGAGKTDVARTVKRIIERWLGRNKRSSIPLVVAHTHAHPDHIA